MTQVSIVAIPESVASAVLGAHDLLGTAGIAWSAMVDHGPFKPLYKPAIVSARRGSLTCFNGTVIHPHRTLEQVASTGVVYVPPLWLPPGATFSGRYRNLVRWIRRMHEQGAAVTAACTGTLLLAESGLLDGQAATTHWAYVDTLQRNYPQVDVRADRAVVESSDGRLITAGAHASWYDLMLQLIRRDGGTEAALQTAKVFLIQWHADGQVPYAVFRANLDHADAVVRDCQKWLGKHYSHPNPVEAAEQHSGLAARTFARRFKEATGLTPITYVQQLRVEQAKSRLESSGDPVERISWNVGYEDVAFFRRLFRRTTGLTPSAYRRRFRVPSTGRAPN
jgi:transcriptional regulator GlxA family with amidase domain